jgi:hypothetical protein
MGRETANQWRRATTFDRTEVAGIIIGIATVTFILWVLWF